MSSAMLIFLAPQTGGVGLMCGDKWSIIQLTGQYEWLVTTPIAFGKMAAVVWCLHSFIRYCEGREIARQCPQQKMTGPTRDQEECVQFSLIYTPVFVWKLPNQLIFILIINCYYLFLWQPQNVKSMLKYVHTWPA